MGGPAVISVTAAPFGRRRSERYRLNPGDVSAVTRRLGCVSGIGCVAGISRVAGIERFRGNAPPRRPASACAGTFPR
jgi:hypothetical protein